jgi:KDO2-lipid IV(A) lauroyltransferase
MLLLLRALTRVPLPLLHATATFVYFVAFYVLRWRRAQTARDIANAFPEKSAAERAAIQRRSYRRAADTVMEAVWGFGASAEALRQRVTMENPQIVRACADAGQTVVLLTAHYANWEWLLLAAGVHFDIPINVVYQPQRVAAIDDFFRNARSRFGSKLIARKEFIFELMTHGSEPRAYALIADQTPKPHDPKHWTQFLHQDTAFFVGAGRIARFLDAQVVYVGMERVRRGAYAVRLTVLAEPPYDDGADEVIVERYAQALEQAVRKEPASFLWLQKRWKYAKPAAPAPLPADRIAAR